MKHLLIATLLVLTACAPEKQQQPTELTDYSNYVCQDEAEEAFNFCVQYQATESYCIKQIIDQFCEEL